MAISCKGQTASDLEIAKVKTKGRVVLEGEFGFRGHHLFLAGWVRFQLALGATRTSPPTTPERRARKGERVGLGDRPSQVYMYKKRTSFI